LIITVYLSVHNLLKELIELSLTEPERYLNRAIFKHLELIPQHYLPPHRHDPRHVSHPWHSPHLVCSLQVFDELFNGESVSLDIHVLLVLGFPSDSGLGKDSGEMLKGFVIVDSLGDEFLCEFPRLVKVLEHEGFEGGGVENVGD
jgi:hypothetical protein